MIDLDALVGKVVPHIYITRELRALGLTDQQITKATRDKDAPKGTQLVPRAPHLFLREEVDAYVARKRALLGLPLRE
jgi:hypothetical protein